MEIQAAQRVGRTLQIEVGDVRAADVGGLEFGVAAPEAVGDVDDAREQTRVVHLDDHAGTASIDSSTEVPDGIIGQTFSIGKHAQWSRVETLLSKNARIAPRKSDRRLTVLVSIS